MVLRRRSFAALLFFALCTISELCQAAPSHEPRRIVSLSPGVTEILFALNLGKRVVGDTYYCDYPAAAKLKPHIGDVTTNYEAVLALHPDLVIADAIANRASIPRLKALNTPLMVIQATSLSDVERNITAIGAATGVQTVAAKVVATMRRKERQAVIIASHSPKSAPHTLIVVGLNPLYVAGAHSFVGSMVALGGGKNVATADGFAPWSKETAIAALPEVIFCGAEDRASLTQDAAWRSTPAIRLGNLFTVDANLIFRPGPRLADGLIAVANDLARARRAH